MKKLSAIMVGIAALLGGMSTAQAALYDLTSSGATALDGTVRYTQTSPQPTGTGVIGSFVKFQTANGNVSVEQAYNTTADGTYDNGSDATHNHEITVGQVGFINTVDGPVMRFLLDINEPRGGEKEFLKINEIQLYLSTTPNQSLEPVLAQGQTIPFANSSLVYQLDAGGDDTIKMDASLNSGSGSGDMFMDIPLALYTAAFATLPGATTLNDAYIYLYTRGSYADGGFEEWAAISGRPVSVPEPASLALFGIGLAGLAGLRRRNKASS